MLIPALLLCFTFEGLAQQGRGDNTTAEDFATILKAPTRATRDLTDLPSSYSLKDYAPVPQNQGQYGTCVAWSSAYAARTISYAIKHKTTNDDSIRKYSFSPGYIYYKIKKEGDQNCSGGAFIGDALSTMSSTGVMLKREGPSDCTSSVSPGEESSKASPYRIKDFLALNETFGTITKNEVIKIKKSLTENKPVVFSIRCFPSLSYVSGSGIWNTQPGETTNGGHAMCIIGYNDNKAGGAFEVMNSWGTNWGNGGFWWISYEQLMAHGKYAAEMMDIEPEDPRISGNIEFIKLDGSTMPVTRSKINSRSIIVEDDARADYSLYKFTETYTGGTAFKLKFSTNAQSYIYVFAEDDKQEISRLFPYNRTVSAAVNSPNATYYFPSESKHARLNAAPGKENICVLYSKSEIPFEELMTYITDSKTTIYQAVKDKLADRLLDLKEVNFKDDQIVFEAPAKENSVLCFFIEMDHK